jgi:hypothetical protein
MKNKMKKQKTQNSRRNFLQSAGMFIAGFSVLRPSVFAAGKNLKGRKEISSSDFSATELQSDVLLPAGVSAVWDISKAYHETTPTREHICINGLWQWQPGTVQSDQVPVNNWGYFKVPANWPGIKHYLMKESQQNIPASGLE